MARVRFNQPQISLTARTRGSILVRQVVNEVEAGARRLIPVGDHRSGSGAPARNKSLLSTLYSSVRVNSSEVRGRVGVRTRHAETVHQGSQAHTIRARSGTKMLKFRWERGDFLVAARAGRRRGNRRTGQFHFFARVRHPGNKRPVQYLVRPLHMFGRLSGFQTYALLPGRGRLP